MTIAELRKEYRYHEVYDPINHRIHVRVEVLVDGKQYGMDGALDVSESTPTKEERIEMISLKLDDWLRQQIGGLN